MLSPKLVSWQLLLVVVWTCAVLVKPWAADGSLFASSKSLSSIEGARAYNSFFGASSRSIYSTPSDLEEQRIVESTPKDKDQADRKATGSPAALLPSISQTHTSLLQNAPTLLRSPRDILDRLTSRKRGQQDTRPTGDILSSQIPSSQAVSDASQTRDQVQQIQVQDEHVALEPESGAGTSVLESARKDQLSSVNDCAETSFSAIVSNNGPSDANTTADAHTRRFQNPLSMYDLSSGRSKAQGSCFGLVVGMIVAIVWL